MRAGRRGSADGRLQVPLLPAGASPPTGRAARLPPSSSSRCQLSCSTPSSHALAVGETRGGRAVGDFWEARRGLVLRASPQTASRVPFPAPMRRCERASVASAGVSVKCVCAGECAEGAREAGGAGGGRQGAGEGAGRECVRACNSTPGLCASPGDSIGGGWRRSGRRRVLPSRQRLAAGAGGSPRGSGADASRSRVREEPGRSPGASLAGGPWAAAGRGGRPRGSPPVRCARRRGAPPTRSGAQEPGSWARRRLGGCCAPAPRAAAPGSPPRPRPGHARRRPTMTAPWRRLRSLVWEYWAGLLVCAFWIPDSRGMPHVIRIGKGSPEPRVSARPGGGGNGAAEHDPKRFCQPLRAAGPCDHKELFPVRTKFQAWVTGLTY